MKKFKYLAGNANETTTTQTGFKSRIAAARYAKKNGLTLSKASGNGYKHLKTY